ncbi:MAG: hypothetical protein FWF75_06075 [Propionibacteriaceae bacterium]|nr:hypothetical protein [Propionibacteriaceae bacterium]
MFDVEGMLHDARMVLREYVWLRAELDELQARTNDALGKAVLAYEVLDDLPEHQRPDRYRATRLGAHMFAEDLIGEIAVANHSSEMSARVLIDAVARLMHDLPDCWDKVTDETVRAPLWQARKVLDACTGLDHDQHHQVDAAVSPALGTLPPRRLSRLASAQVMRADPKDARLKAKLGERYVRTGGDASDPMTGWVYAKTSRADAIFMEATVQLIADTLASQGDQRDPDQRRAAAFGILANPAAAVQLIGVHTTRGMDPAPASQADADQVIEQAKRQTPLQRRTQLYVHVHADSLDNPDEVARIEGIGPLLIGQVKALTAGSSVRVTKVVHVGAGSVGVDAYEIPDRIREQVIARDAYTLAPWSSVESRHQDLDHIIAYQEGIPNQTRADNLAPQTRGYHRWKTHAGWQATPAGPGTLLWTTGAGQIALVNNTGTHPLRTCTDDDSHCAADAKLST